MQPLLTLPESPRDGVLLLVLTGVLLAATWPFFGAFAVGAVAAGLSTSIALRAWYRSHPNASRGSTVPEHGPELNVSAIHVGGDLAGLVFVAGSVAIFILSMPSLRWFLVASVLIASAIATVVVRWRRAHTLWTRGTSVVRRG